LSSLKFAIINGDQDLLRIIPVPTKVPTTIDFKISTLGNEYAINYWALGLQKPKYYRSHDEITYHSSVKTKENLKPGIIHEKRQNAGCINYQYSFPKVTDIQVNTEFPLPLLKLSINQKGAKAYTKKNDHVIFNFGDESKASINTVEIYIASKQYDGKFIQKWPFFDLLWEVSTIDYLVKGPELSPQFLKRLNDGPSILYEMDTSFPQFNLISKFYFDENFTENTISFYENFDYVSILASTRIQLIDELTKEPRSPLDPAFVFDLSRQQNQGYPKKEIAVWNKFFNDSLNKIDRLGIHRNVFYFLLS
jgi:hypothetical protein